MLAGIQEKQTVKDYGNVSDIYCDDLGRIEVLGQTVRFKGVVFEIPEGMEAGPPWTKVVNVRVVVPLRAIPSIMRQLFEAFGDHVASRTWGAFREKRQHLVS